METKDRQEFAALRDSNLKTASGLGAERSRHGTVHLVYERPATNAASESINAKIRG
jgi:hypothetical protein